MEKVKEIRYCIIAERFISPERGSYVGYAILCEAEQENGSWDLLEKIPDVTDEQEEAEQLAALCTEGALDPCQLPEIVEDWLNR